MLNFNINDIQENFKWRTLGSADLKLIDYQIFLQQNRATQDHPRILQFGVCHHDELLASPGTATEGRTLVLEGTGRWEGYSQQGVWLLMGWVLAREESLSSLALQLSQSVGVPPSGSCCLFLKMQHIPTISESSKSKDVKTDFISYKELAQKVFFHSWLPYFYFLW